MRQLVTKLKPAEGFSSALHWGLVILVPLVVFVLVRMHFVQLAVAVILLSKWRMFAVRPRYWLTNIRANAVDIIVGLSLLIFMMQTDSAIWQFLWTIVYGAWVVGLKPRTGQLLISVQAMVGQLLGLLALFIGWTAAPLYGVVLVSGVVCYLAARHFFEAYEEPYNKFLSYLWGYFGASLTWLMGHWLLFYGVIAQPTLLLLVLGYGLAALYYLDHTGRLTKLLRQECIAIMITIVIVVLAFSNWWGNRAI